MSAAQLTMDQTFEIINGVRRSKAAHMAGHDRIRARLYSQGAAKLIQEFDVPIDCLRSPHKSSIRQVTPGDQIRWQRVVAGAKQHPLPFPPIEIVEGSRGVKIEDVTFDSGNDP
jgi:hypothetical protein